MDRMTKEANVSLRRLPHRFGSHFSHPIVIMQDVPMRCWFWLLAGLHLAACAAEPRNTDVVDSLYHGKAIEAVFAREVPSNVST
jgi:hypothetical protein